MSTTIQPSETSPDPYLDLVQSFRLRRITTDEELDQAIAVLDSLVDRESLDEGEQEYLDVLSDLVYSYETSEHPICSSSDSEVLRHLMDANGLKQRELADKVGVAESVISEILSGKRKLNRRQVESVSRCFRISTDAFLT